MLRPLPLVVVVLLGAALVYGAVGKTTDVHTQEEYDEYAEMYGYYNEDVHPQLHPQDICGSWHEVGSCYVKQCDVKKFNHVAAQYTTKPMDGKMTPHDPSEKDWVWYDYVHTQEEYDRDYCGNEKHEVFSMTILGEFAMPPDQKVQGWTEMEQLPHTYIIKLNDSYTEQYTQLWPTGECANAIDYLNEKCPCGGEWKAGTFRAITMDFGPDAPNAHYCHKLDPNCKVCHQEECEGLFNLRLQGNIQMSSKDAMQLAKTVAGHDAHPPDGYTSIEVDHELQRDFADGEGGYNGCKAVYPMNAADSHHDGKQVEKHHHETVNAYVEKAPDDVEDKEEEHHQNKVHTSLHVDFDVHKDPHHDHHPDQVQAQSVGPSSSATKLHQVLKRQTSGVSVN